MKKNNSKPASMLLVTGAMLVFLSGCTEALTETGSFTGTLDSTIQKDKIEIVVQDKNYRPVPLEEIIEPIVMPEMEIINDSLAHNIPSDIVEKDNSSSTNIPVSNEQVQFEQGSTSTLVVDSPVQPITDIESYCKYLEGLTCNENPLLVLLTPEEHSKEKLEIAAYIQLKNCGLTIADVEGELHNILVYSQYPRCCSAEEFEMLVGKLHKTLAYGANPFSSYHALSRKVHELTCGLEHTEEYGIYTCDTLKMLGEEVRPLTLIEYLDKEIIDNYGYQKIKEALSLNPDHYIDDYITELENLVRAQLYPTGVSEEVWQMLFGKLNATLGEYESLYETYIELAVLIHNMLYPDDVLTKNELGIYTSRTLKLEIPN